MLTMDIFNNNAFEMMTMTKALYEEDYIPEFLEGLNLFEYNAITTIDVHIEKDKVAAALVSSSDRGAPMEKLNKSQRNMYHFQTVRLAKEASINADEIQNVRAFGNGDQLMGMQYLVDKHKKSLINSIRLTQEYHRLGAVQGKVMDSDGRTVLNNLYNAFKVSEPSEINFDLAAVKPDPGALGKKCSSLRRGIIKSLDGLAVSKLKIMALCGSNFYDTLKNHGEVKEVWLASQNGAALSSGMVYSHFTYGDIEWVDYPSFRDDIVGIPDDKARVFPVGVPGLFQTFYAPVDIIKGTNEPGLPMYLWMPDDRKTERSVTLEIQSNPATLCMRPQALRGLKLSA